MSILINQFAQIDLSPTKIETERLIIQSFQDKDFEDSVLLYGDAEITKYFDFGTTRSRNEVKALINRYIIYTKETEYLGLFSIFEKETMHFIGHIDLVPSNTSGILEVGYIIHKRYQKCKLALETLNAIIYAYIPKIKNKIYNNQFYEVMATVHPQNKASIKLLEGVGMKYECELTRFYQPRLNYAISI